MPVSASLLPTPANPIATPPYCTSSWRLETSSRLRQVGFIVCSRQQQTDSPQKRVIEYFEQLLSGFVLPRSDFVSFHLEASKSLDLLLHFCASYGFAAEGIPQGCVESVTASLMSALSNVFLQDGLWFGVVLFTFSQQPCGRVAVTARRCLVSQWSNWRCFPLST